MKRRNIIFTLLAAAGAVLFVLPLAGCKSTKAISDEISAEKVEVIPKVDPLAVLDGDSAVYFRVPVADHKPFVKSLLLSNIDGMADADAETIVNHLDMICLGVGTKENPKRLQLAASGSIPRIAVKTALSEKKGWTKFTDPVTYYTHPGTKYQLAVPTTANVFLADDVSPLVENYKTVLGSDTESVITAQTDGWNDEVYEWMTAPGSAMRFCVLRPQAFLARLLGVDMRFALEFASGELTAVKQDDTAVGGVPGDAGYELSMKLVFQKARVVRAALAVLSLAFGDRMQATAENGSNVLQVSGIHVSNVTVLDLLVE